MADNAGPASPHEPAGPAPRDAGHADPATTSWRSFAVEAYIGRKAAGWPLARFDVGAQILQVRLLFPWFVTRSAGRDTITFVSVARHVGPIWCVRFHDTGQRLADVHVHMPLRAQRIIDELRRHEYTVTDNSGQPLIRLPKPWHPA
jgi:hypothetical protein